MSVSSSLSWVQLLDCVASFSLCSIIWFKVTKSSVIKWSLFKSCTISDQKIKNQAEEQVSQVNLLKAGLRQKDQWCQVVKQNRIITKEDHSTYSKVGNLTQTYKTSAKWKSLNKTTSKFTIPKPSTCIGLD
jgi:hypothetical protein